MPHDRITFRQQAIGMAFAAPYLCGVAIFVLLPLGLALYLSFTQYPMLQPPMWIGADNYARLLHDPIFWKVLRNTLLYAAGSVPISLAVSILLALLLNRPVPGRAIFRTIVFLPSLVPLAAAAMLWIWILNGQQGLLNVALRGASGLLHLPAPPLPNWLADASLIIPIFIFLSLYGVGNAVIIFLAGLQDIPVELYEAAQIDGARPLQRLRHITLPMLSPVIFFNLIMGIIASWQIFTMPYIMVGTTANRAGYFYSQYLFDKAFMDLDMGYASALAWIQFAIIATLTVAMVWTSRRWVHYR